MKMLKKNSENRGRTELSSKISNVLGILLLPIITYAVFSLITRFNGILLIENRGHFLTLIRSVVVITFTSWALMINLNSGRFDFSVGSIALLSSMVSAKMAIYFDLSPLMMLVLAALTGLILGLFSGLLYITLRLAPIISSLGVTLIYEALTYVVTNGEGLLISTHLDLLVVSSTKWLIAVGVIFLLIMYLLMEKTSFGFDHAALESGQRISNQTGINEKRNVLISYSVSGMLMGVVGCINIATRGSVSVSLNFSSISLMFVAFLPLFIGGYIGRKSNEVFGVFLGAITSSIITLGFVRLGVTSQVQSLINAVILVVFLIYLNNEEVIRKIFMVRK